MQQKLGTLRREMKEERRGEVGVIFRFSLSHPLLAKRRKRASLTGSHLLISTSHLHLHLRSVLAENTHLSFTALL